MFIVEGSATAIEGADGASLDTANGEFVDVAEYPGVPDEPLHPAEEEEPLSHCLCDGVGVVSPGQVLAGANPVEPEAAD